MLHRRGSLARTAGSLGALALLTAASVTAQPAPPPPPRAQAHADTAHGVVVPDEYRWMETAGAALDPWIDAEDAHARATLDAMPGRTALQARIAELWQTGDRTESVLDERAGRTLVLDYTLDRPRLGVRDGDGPLRILHDPEGDGSEQGASVRRSATRLSPDGRHATVALVERGEANPRLRILDVATGAWLPETLTPPLWADADGFYVAWLPDGQHLLWARNPARTAATPDGERELNGHVYLHRLGTNPAADAALFGPSLQPSLRADDTPYPGVSADGRWAVVRVRHASPGRSLWVAPLDGTRVAGPFREVVTSEGGIAGWGVRGDTLWAVVPDGAPRHRLVRAPLRDPSAAPETVLEGHDGVLAGLAVAADALYLTQRDGAVSSLWRLGADGVPAPIALPRPGILDRLAPGPDGRGARARLRSGVYPDDDVAVAPGAGEARALRPPPPGLPGAWAEAAVTVVHAPARDGVLVPVSLLHAHDAPRDGTGFVWMEVYGCYGSPRELFYDPANLAWLERGGTLAVAHVRGGGEYGRDWHQANVARGHATASEDAVDAVEHLVRGGWAAPGRVALAGASCGAATAGVAALSRPDLIAAASLVVGGVDEWRAWSETASGARSVLDIGDPATALGVRRVVAASPYHRLLPGARQPAWLLLNGGTDYTVPLWMGAKFVARARATAGPGSGPLLFRVERDAGHSGPTDFEGQLRAYTDERAFVLWQLGHPDFQPTR
ncbi:MAG TPA: prolyl oligopeptidase family serine peptidase [Rubricoccaceae bacterium]|nr:prolyl oligopeptidase family serine peptidase [Rubricoccaceae bacterium]